jgi:hypothetical protein
VCSKTQTILFSFLSRARVCVCSTFFFSLSRARIVHFFERSKSQNIKNFFSLLLFLVCVCVCVYGAVIVVVVSSGDKLLFFFLYLFAAQPFIFVVVFFSFFFFLSFLKNSHTTKQKNRFFVVSRCVLCERRRDKRTKQNQWKKKS